MLDVAEREAHAVEQIMAAMEEVCPYIVGNPFIPHWPFPQQLYFLGLHTQFPNKDNSVFQALYGGAAGGGKSDALLMALAQYAWHFGEFSGAAFRRTHADLALPGALMDRALEWWLPAGVHWNGTDKIFTFPSGAKVKMGHMSKPAAHLEHQGAEYHQTVWDELTQHPTDIQYKYVALSRCRRNRGCFIPLRALSGSNPGGPGHEWVQADFVGGRDTVTGHEMIPRYPFVASKVTDNPFLDQKPYLAGLDHLHPTIRAQLRDGDWSAREPGDYFQREWFGSLLDPAADTWPMRDCTRIRWWDLAASQKEGSAFTSGVRMAKHTNGSYAIEHCVSFRRTPGARDALILQTAQADGHGTIVGLEIEGGSGGPAQFDALEAMLSAKGYRVVGARPRSQLSDKEAIRLQRGNENLSAKMGRAGPVSSELERGWQMRGESPPTAENQRNPYRGLEADRAPYRNTAGIRLFAGPWTHSYLSIVENFPDGHTCDEVDATSGAYSWLATKAANYQRPVGNPYDEAAVVHDRFGHPDEADDHDPDQSANGRWKN